MRTSHILRGHLRLFAPWLNQITAANVLDREIATAFVSRFQELADELDAPFAEAPAVDPHPEPSVRFVAVPHPFAGAAPNVVPFLPRNPE